MNWQKQSLMPYIYGYNFLGPHNLLTSCPTQAFVENLNVPWTCNHLTVYGAQLWWQHKVVKNTYCSVWKSLDITCIAPETRAVDQFMKHEWMKGNLESTLNHAPLIEPSFHSSIAIYIHLIIGTRTQSDTKLCKWLYFIPIGIYTRYYH